MLSLTLVFVLLISIDGIAMLFQNGEQKAKHFGETVHYNPQLLNNLPTTNSSTSSHKIHLWNKLCISLRPLKVTSNSSARSWNKVIRNKDLNNLTASQIMQRNRRDTQAAERNANELNISDSSEMHNKVENVSQILFDENLPQRAAECLNTLWKANATKEAIRKAQAQLMKMYMDTTVEPCDDFYAYACGNWHKVHPMRKDQKKIGYIEIMRDKLNDVLRELLETDREQLAQDSNSKDAKQKTKILYASCINMKERNRLGIQPLLDLFDKWGGWPILTENWNSSNFDWVNLTAQIRLYENYILINQYIRPDLKNSQEHIIQFDQTKLGLPTRDYYIQEEYSTKLQAYESFMAGVMHKMGAERTKAAHTARALIRFEIQLAGIVRERNSSWYSDATQHRRMTLGELQSLIPGINWQRYLTIVQERSVIESEEVVLHASEYMMDLVTLINSTAAESVANYLFWRFAEHRINNLDDRFDGLRQTFNQELLGREENPALWKYCIAEVNSLMGMPLGAMFVLKHFNELSRKDVSQMTHDIKQTFRENLETLDWLDADTKRLAELKADTMSLLIGYPFYILFPDKLNQQHWDLKVHPDKYFENILSVLQHTTRSKQLKLYNVVEGSLRPQGPAAINAFYTPYSNQITFSAGILQAPFYSPHFPKAITLSGIGMFIGHELTHGFDDRGRQYDHKGNVQNWWSNASLEGFKQRAGCYVEQYGNYFLGDVAIDGVKSAGENIADNGGIKMAYKVYTKWLEDNPALASDERLPGVDMTAEQIFFLSFGQKWCSTIRKEAIRNILSVDNHSPGRYRVIGSLSNMEEFSMTFKCPLGSPMNPVHKCNLW